MASGAASETLTELPKGTFPLVFSAGLNQQLGVGKRRREEDQLLAFRYNFKPASVTRDTPGVYQSHSSGGRVTFDTSNGRQVFEVREEASRPRECVLIYDEATQSFTLHPLPSTLHLTLDRNASASLNARHSPSQASSASSSSIPLARRQIAKEELDEEQSSFSSGGTRQEVSSMVGAADDTPRPASNKKAKTSLSNTNKPSVRSSASAGTSGAGSRATNGGKGLPRKRPLESAPIPVLTNPPRATKTKGKATSATATSKTTNARGKKAAPAVVVAPITPTKFKSAEFIEDSDEETAGAGEDENEEEDDEEEDEFANLLGKSLAEADDEDEDEEEESDDEDEDDELGGARLVVRDQGVPILDDGSEWI
ncbi:hypothetical protein IAR55_002729 [Kwoniella newhampshirensis]|uniref:Transcription elongation factor Eaf N-terminal domain-containing protein n=1 Tax=Kwoniella newhampshirensis TaxID=1651941 RepID=A0AAW0YNI6_9TREE